jgi:tetratricopeptide (TPR) repeat protein
MENQQNNFALIIGVGGPKIEYTVNDAKKLRDNLINKDLVGYPEDNVIVLTEKEATKDGILAKFDELREKTNKDSTILLYYSGHGGRDAEKNKYYLYPHDEQKLNADDLRDKINALPSNKLVLFLDCCHAEGLVQSGISGLYGMAQKLNDEQGIWVLASCQDNQESYGPVTEVPEEKNSFFTEALLEVLSGKHKRPFTDPAISIMDVVEYIFEVVPERAGEYWVSEDQPCVQTPYFKTQMSENLILSYFPKNAEDHEAIIRELEPKVDELDEENFLKLVKSMEAVGRVDEAIKTLKGNKRTKSDADLMEALGDLYRNKYLISKVQKDGDDALAFHLEAYELAIETEDEEQVFTNAVKIAFMFAKLDQNKRVMREYALKAYEAAHNYFYPSVTKFVTMAEANIYLGNIDEAKKHYQEVADKAGIRYKMKCFDRAQMVYNTLFKPENEKDEFIVFLEETLLT